MDALQVIAEPRRRQILALVWDKEMAAGEIAARSDVTFGAVSQHLSVLRGAGFVSVRRDGNRRLYLADKDRLGPLSDVLEVMWSQAIDDLADTIAADRAAENGER
ncbi:MAG: ArsR/SmtB family transcription factor [Acidimicrobiia bacterium]